MEDLENLLNSILIDAVRENRNADGWTPEAKAALYANSKGYDKEVHGKLGRQFDSNPNIRVYPVSKTERFLTLVNADYQVSELPESSATKELHKAGNVNYKTPEISEVQFEYLKPLIRRYQDLSESHELCKSVISNEFRKLSLENKVLKAGPYVLWNTGLQTCSHSNILGYGKTDGMGNVWVIKFCDEHSSCADKLHERFGQRPLAAEYGEPTDTVFNPELEIRLNAYHILVERYYRFPNELKELTGIHCDKNNWKEHRVAIEKYMNFIQLHLIGAIEQSKRFIRQRRDMPVKSWDFQHNSMCWLMPIDMGVETPKYMALLLEYCVEGEAEYYKAHTVYDSNMAYKCARQVEPVSSDWLKWPEN